MKLKKINLKNFLSIENASIDLDNRGIVLIDGNNKTPATTIDTNGTGKSSMLSSIFYSFYGELPSGEKADALINRNFGKDMLVDITFDISGVEYRIERGRKKNKFNLYANGVDITKGTMKETQSLLESIIQIPKDVYLSTIYFDGHNSIPFSMLTDKQRKDYLEVLFDVGVYKEAHEQTKLDIVQVKSDIESKKSSILSKTSLINNEKSTISQLKSIRSDSKDSLLKYKNLLEDATSKLDEWKIEFLDKFKLIDSKKKEINLLLDSDYNDTDYTYNKQKLDKVRSDYNKLNIGQETKRAVINEKAASIKKMSSSEICPICGNKIDEEHKKKEVNRLMSELNPIVDEYKSKSETLDSYKLELNELIDKNKELEKSHSKIESDRREKYLDLEKLSTAENNLNLAKNKLESNLEQAQSNYNKSLDDSTKYDGIILEHEKNMEMLNSDLESLNSDLDNLVKYEIKLESALQAFSDKGIKSHVLDLVTPELNYRVSNYLSFLTGGTINIEFSTQTKKSDGELSDKFDIKVTNNGQDTTYESLSSGEKRRVDIAISLTLQDILMSKSNTSSNVLIYDELFESLDAVGAESVVELLKNRLDTANTIFVVTHNENLKPLFSETIIAVKEKDGNTHIENGEVNR